jgi:ectoine hydroxylase-related dioxygenase (phytanoyl-CoA dioxygenase family)
MLEIEILNPSEIERAAKIFLRDGFVAIRDAIVGEQLRRIQAAATRVIEDIAAADPERKGNRGHHRYSFGNQTRHFEWCELVDLPTILPIVEAIWKSDRFICSGAGGDFSLPTAEIQPLHSDGNEMGFTDPFVEQVTLRDLPPPVICVNFLMVDFTKENGAIRQIPCTHRSNAPIPTLAEEPPWMKNCIVCAPAGTALVRDVRCWHGGTPNNSDHPRPMTNAEYYAPWFRGGLPKVLPRQHYERMSPRAQHLCRYIVEDA